MILVTGADGYIGRQVCELLSSQGQTVLATDREFTAIPAYQHILGDLSDADFIAKLQAYPITTIIHLAGILALHSMQHPERAMQINIGGSLALLNLPNIKRFVYGSTIAVYGFKPSSAGLTTEDSPAAPAIIYGASKRFVELAGAELQKQRDFQFIAARIPVVVGAGAFKSTAQWRSQIFEQLNVTEPTTINLPFDRSPLWPMAHVTEVAKCLVQLAIAPQVHHTIYNLPAENLTTGELGDYVEQLNPLIRMQYGEPASGFTEPQTISSERFCQEFSYELLTIWHYLQQTRQTATA